MTAGKEIKSRIKSVKNTGKITKAMELISTVKMKKAQENLFTLRPFALAVLSILEQIAEDDSIFASYTQAPESSKELIVLIASNKGLCWGYNVNIFKELVEYIRTDDDAPYTQTYDYITIGKRAREFILRTGQTLSADFSDKITDGSDSEDVGSMVRLISDLWKTGQYAKISVIYSQYVSPISQVPIVKTLFPFHQNDIRTFLRRIAYTGVVWEIEEEPKQNKESFTIEPSPRMVLEYALPMILSAMVHETVLEAHTSEHAARMVAMKNAKDAAGKKARVLTLAYNKARQWAITTEITEIVSGVESMKD